MRQKQKLKKKSPLPKRDSVLPVVKGYSFWCGNCKSVHLNTLDCKTTDTPQAEKEGPACLCDYFRTQHRVGYKPPEQSCPKHRTENVRPQRVFDLAGLVASTKPLPRFQYGTDAEGIAAGFPRERANPPDSSQNGPSFPVSAPRKGIPATPPVERKESPVLSERKPVPIPLPVPIASVGTLPLPGVEREGKKPKIVLCGQRFGLSYIFLWMGVAGWSHQDLERFCSRLKIELPSINTTQSRLRAGRNKDSVSYGKIPKLSKKQEELLSNTIKGGKK